MHQAVKCELKNVCLVYIYTIHILLAWLWFVILFFGWQVLQFLICCCFFFLHETNTFGFVQQVATTKYLICICCYLAKYAYYMLNQWFPTFFDTFIHLLILELFIPPQWNFHSSPVQVRRLVLTTIGTMVFIDDNDLINKSGTKTVCCKIIGVKFINKNV